MFSNCSQAPPFPTFNTVPIGIFAAARLMEWGVKILKSILADCNVVLIHLAKMSCDAIL